MCLVFLVYAFAGLSPSNTDGSVVGSDVEFLSGNTLLLTLIITFFLASKRNPKLFREVFFFDWFLNFIYITKFFE